MGNKSRPSELITPDELARIIAFTKDKETPCLVIDLKKVAEKYDELVRVMSGAKIYYAVKANPLDEVIKLFRDRGAYFDVASRFEIDQLLGLDVPPERMSYGNTIKKEVDIIYAYRKGIRLYTTDSRSDIEKLSRSAPGAKVNFRLLLDGSGADWPLSKKFGAHPDMVYKLVKFAKKSGLMPYGISFHVGSQQRDIGQWDNAIALVRYLFDALKNDGIRLNAINLGGGFPAQYLKPTDSVLSYADSIIGYLREDFPDGGLDIIVEPGRSLVADAGIIVTEVVLISKKSERNRMRWIYLDVGKFNGLIETIGEAIKYPIVFAGRDGKEEWSEVVLAGPTCDSADILYEDYKYKVPNNLKEGERVYILTAGAYTMSYSSVGFNGFPPIATHILQ
ncbi:MAG: ornithine decarboxylase [Candidatus Lloydbacteria bacterium RIFCSPLOWO2_01_FULL_50_20]|uniref:Ornithine decarboxylase n=1 Tax=Candidatus Lloydbacteria bacterium RIFCSPLOWO2_01_FULL_50_20 TaxID=1798665 RepID=A0A1G2DG49_9BACT|nr:MAG: ornithine decarboxylase [Candidatus Lloydbacteria bacterium RIFCSPLOWO2_01_FULL_50_20]